MVLVARVALLRGVRRRRSRGVVGWGVSGVGVGVEDWDWDGDWDGDGDWVRGLGLLLGSGWEQTGGV